MRKEKGITLVALVITIIVMLILSAVTINLTLGERGIFNTATSAVEKQKIAEYLEKIELSRVEVSSYNMGKVTIDDLKAQILKDKIVIPPSEGTITKIDEEKLNMTTKEGYIFFIYEDKAEYIGKDGEIPTPPEIKDGDVEVVIEPMGWTNQNKKVTMTQNLGDNYKIQYSLDNGVTWKDYTATFEIYENTQICVCLRNVLGIQGTYATYRVDKIDREAPVITNVTSNPTSITFSAKDEASGIVGYKVTTTTEEPTEFEIITNIKEITNQTVNVEKQNTTYYIWVKDQAGNVSAYSTTKTTTQAVTKINITPTTAKIKPNETIQLTASVLPENAYNKEITWKSGNENIATVSSTGLVTAKETGSTTITVTSTYGENGTTIGESCTVMVYQEWGDITAANYGDYVNYEDGLDLGSSAYGHATDWRIFYKNDDGYVYLIASYYLPYTQVPSGTNLQGYEGLPYTSYWPTTPSSYTNVPQSTFDRYKMNFKYNGSPNNGYNNMKCVSELIDTSKWRKFVNTIYAEDAIGAPTLEMWVESWNKKNIAKKTDWTTLKTSIPNQIGYYINDKASVNIRLTGGYKDTLYFPVSTNKSDMKGYNCWLTSPSAANIEALMFVNADGYIYASGYDNNSMSVRPIVRLKNTVSAEKNNAVWELK